MSLYSSRLPWNAAPNRFTQRLEQVRRAGARLLDLTESNPTRAGIAYDEAAIAGALGDPAALVYDPSPRGLARARQAVAGFEHVDPDRVILTASTSEAYSYLFKLFADPGAEILAPRPSYPLLEFLTSLDGLTLRHYSLRYQEGWWLDRESLLRAITPATRAIVVVNPNNPTGSYVTADEFAWLATLGLPVIADEVFRVYAHATAPAPAPPGIFRLNGLSKLLGLPQMKLAWIVVPDTGGLDAHLHRLDLIADSYLSVSAPVQHALPRWLALQPRFHSAMMDRLSRNLGILQRMHGLSPLTVQGGWYGVVRLPVTRTDEEWALALMDRGVLVQPGYFYDFEADGYAVVSLLTPPAAFEEGLQILWHTVS
ncbi:MAG: pyridoxal phosphate-dependent aminotransferase [Bryobacteraceae bacterium]